MQKLRLFERQGAFAVQNPLQSLLQFHAGEAAALAFALEADWWLLINEQRALTFARLSGIKAVTVPEFIVYLYQTEVLSYRSAQTKLNGIRANTGQHVM